VGERLNNQQRSFIMTAIQAFLPEDAPAMAAMREAAAPHKGEALGPAARPMLDTMIAATPATAGVVVEPGMVGGIAGFWCRPINAQRGARILYLHGGGYVLGSAQAFTNFVGQIAVRTGADTFVADYRLAPEHPFPAAMDDAVAAYLGLAASGTERIVVVGDSAGGGLTLALLSMLISETNILQPAGAAVMSPWTDLALTGASFRTRAEADPIFTHGALEAFASAYLQGHNATDPKASPLYGALKGLPPIRIDAGDDEVLLDDSIRYAAKARAAGSNVELVVWTGMPHVFQTSLGQFRAAEHSVAAICDFLRRRLINAAPSITNSLEA